MSDSSVFQPGLLTGKVAFVTGGGSGINKQIAMTYAKSGAAVAIVGRDGNKAQAVADQICESGGKAVGISADVRDEGAMALAFEKAKEELGAFDIVIAGAAGNFVCAAEEMSANGFRAVVETDLLGTFNTFKGALPHCVKPGAVMVAISAGQSTMPTFGQAHVCAAKAGVDMLVKVLAIEWAAQGIRCIGIAPGPVTDTEGMARLAPEGQSSWQRLLAAIPSGRGATKEEIAEFALFLVSSAAGYINGAVLPIDGGINAVGSLDFGRMLQDSLRR